MRSADEIRTQILLLRDKKRIDSTKIAEDSRCSRAQLMQALQMKATENVLRRLDAYLDATHLHVQEPDHSELMYRIEQLDREMFRQFGLKNLHPLTVSGMSKDSKIRHLNAMHWRAKKALREKAEQEYKIKFSFPDTLDYWGCKRRLCRRVGVTYRGPGPRYRKAPAP